MSKEQNTSVWRRYGVIVAAATLFIGVLAVYQSAMQTLMRNMAYEYTQRAVVACPVKQRADNLDRRLEKMEEKIDVISDNVASIRGWLLHNGFMTVPK